ncbi:hypothetical protein MHI57_17140 [Cytobacillus sp. FSL K6-0129]
MKWLFAILLLMLLLFYYYRLFNVFFKIKKNKVFLLPDEVLEDIRIEPQRPIAEPKVASQKGSIFTYIFITCMVFIAIMFIVFSDQLDVSNYLLLLVPLFQMEFLFNQLVFLQKGIVKGLKYIPWHKIDSYEVQSIDINNRHFGFDKKVNDGFEMKLHSGRSSQVSLLVTSTEAYEQLQILLESHGIKQKA